jgi:hypothetical protein
MPRSRTLVTGKIPPTFAMFFSNDAGALNRQPRGSHPRRDGVFCCVARLPLPSLPKARYKRNPDRNKTEIYNILGVFFQTSVNPVVGRFEFLGS